MFIWPKRAINKILFSRFINKPQSSVPSLRADGRLDSFSLRYASQDTARFITYLENEKENKNQKERKYDNNTVPNRWQSSRVNLFQMER